MNLLFLFFHCLSFVSGIKSTESAFESRVNEKDGTVYSSNAKADTLNHSNWNGKSESGDEKSEDEKSNWDEKGDGGDEKSESGDGKTNWDEKSESGEEAKALTRLEIELEELLQSHLEVQIQQQAHQHQEHQPQRAHQHQEYQPQRAQRQQEYDQQEQEHQQQQHRLRMRR